MSGHEGSSPAAWTTVVILILASVVGGLAIILSNWALFLIGGVGLAVVGAIVGKAVSAATSRRHRSGDNAADQTHSAA